MVKYSKISKWILGVGLVTITCNGLQIQAETKEKNVKNVLQMEPVGIQKSVDELAHPSKVQENASFTKRLKLADLSQRPLALNDNIKPLAEEKSIQWLS